MMVKTLLLRSHKHFPVTRVHRSFLKSWDYSTAFNNSATNPSFRAQAKQRHINNLKYSTMASPTRYKLVYTVLNSHLEATKDAIFAAKGGIYADGKYINVCFEIPGNGQFIPVAEAGATPHTGQV